jgi:hypothetical protein
MREIKIKGLLGSAVGLNDGAAVGQTVGKTAGEDVGNFVGLEDG